MAATNAATPATTRASTITQSASTSTSVQQSAASQQQTATSGSNAPAGTGIFNWQLPNIMPSLDQFLGLPTVIDYQDIGIRVSMVVVGVILVILVAWAFVRGQQTQNVTVQTPPGTSAQPEKEAVEAAEVA